MNLVIKEINNDFAKIDDIKEFLYSQIKMVYGIGPTPEFHYDIEGIMEYYILPSTNTFFVACDGDRIVGTAGIRAYDKDYEFFRGIYSERDTASIWRLIVDKEYRRHGIARNLVDELEKFAKKKNYRRIYLNTHRYLEAGIPFWKSLGYKITVEEEDYDETTHMVKDII